MHIAGGSVHTPETKVGAAERRADREADRYFRGRLDTAFPPLWTEEKNFRHGRFGLERRAVIRAGLARVLGVKAGRVLERYDHCGSNAWVVRKKGTGDVRVVSNKCRNRWCDACACERANLIGDNLRRCLRPGGAYLHVVLTLRTTDRPLADEVRRLLRAFKALRLLRLGNPRARKTQNWWGRWVRGGAFFVEAKWSAAGWHPHLHVIAESSRIPWEDLSSLWRVVTGDSSVVWVERIDSRDAAAAEVSKYASKSIDAGTLAVPDKLDELMVSMKGVRLCSTFGAWRGFRLLRPLHQAGEWVNLGPLVDIIRKARAGDDRALCIFRLLERSRASAARPPPK